MRKMCFILSNTKRKVVAIHQQNSTMKNILQTIFITFMVVQIIALPFTVLGQSRHAFPETDVLNNQTIASPLTIEINSLGLWQAHEGELGVVTLLDDTGTKLGTAIMKSKDGNWMTGGEALFLAELEFEQPGTSSGILWFENRVITNEGNNKKESFDVPVHFYQKPARTYYFGARNETKGEHSGSGFHLIKLEVTKDGSFIGTEINAPSGTDGSRSGLQGQFLDDTFRGKTSQLAEGEMYEHDLDLKLKDNAIELGYKKPSGETATLPELSEAAYNELVGDYEKCYLLSRMNTEDRSRLENPDLKENLGLSQDDLSNMKFMELEIELDGIYETREFLLYPYGPMLCGTGGCALFVVNQEGKVLSKTTVVKMPVYTTTSRAVNPAEEKPRWKDLYVWSNGAFRKLVYKNGSYTPNASVANAMAEENLEFNPQLYIKVMDFVDE